MLLISSDRKHAKRAPLWMRSWEIQNWVVQSGDLIQGNQAVKPSAIIWPGRTFLWTWMQCQIQHWLHRALAWKHHKTPKPFLDWHPLEGFSYGCVSEISSRMVITPSLGLRAIWPSRSGNDRSSGCSRWAPSLPQCWWFEPFVLA